MLGHYPKPKGLDNYLDALINQLDDEESKDYWLLPALNRINASNIKGEWWTRI